MADSALYHVGFCYSAAHAAARPEPTLPNGLFTKCDASVYGWVNSVQYIYFVHCIYMWKKPEL